MMFQSLSYRLLHDEHTYKDKTTTANTNNDDDENKEQQTTRCLEAQEQKREDKSYSQATAYFCLTRTARGMIAVRFPASVR